MNFFTLKDVTPLSSIPEAGHVHVLGVCGVAMGQLAIELAERGFTVTGSDREFYDPVASLLAKSSVKTFQGYSPDNISSKVNLVVIGNSISANNPELSKVVECELPYTFFSGVLQELLVHTRKPIVVTGTHGKSTTTSLLATCLHRLNVDAGYFVGAKMPGFESSLSVGTDQVTVIEGDEYDSAFFAKKPKFHFYNPSILLITSLEFDHADIYNSIDDIVHEFDLLLKSLDEGTSVIVCTDFEILRHKSLEWKQKYPIKLLTYGYKDYSDSPCHALIKDSNGSIEIIQDGRETLCLNPLIYGKHNARNCTAAFLALTDLGHPQKSASAAIEAFKGLSRRLDTLIETDDLVVIEDFAHHPTAVREAIGAVRKRFPERILVAVLEPRSNTSRRKLFQTDYTNSLLNADYVAVKRVVPRHNDTPDNILDTAGIVSVLKEKGLVASEVESVNDITLFLKKVEHEKAVVLIMSNGSLDQLRTELRNVFS